MPSSTVSLEEAVNEKGKFVFTPLHNACIFGHTATAVGLIERGATVNEKSQFGETPLFRACVNGHSATPIALLENGAVGVNDRDTRNGSTPSYWACTVMRYCE
jgi:ankyrin repeat protein